MNSWMKGDLDEMYVSPGPNPAGWIGQVWHHPPPRPPVRSRLNDSLVKPCDGLHRSQALGVGLGRSPGGAGGLSLGLLGLLGLLGRLLLLGGRRLVGDVHLTLVVDPDHDGVAGLVLEAEELLGEGSSMRRWMTRRNGRAP